MGNAGASTCLFPKIAVDIVEGQVEEQEAASKFRGTYAKPLEVLKDAETA